MTTIEARHLTLRYGDVVAVDDVSYALAGDGIYGLLGRNGSGKTSLLSVLAGFRKATAGDVLIDGEPVFENARAMRQGARTLLGSPRRDSPSSSLSVANDSAVWPIGAARRQWLG